MPLFNYQCDIEKCGHIIQDVLIPIDKEPTKCQKCKSGKYEKLMGGSNFDVVGSSSSGAKSGLNKYNWRTKVSPAEYQRVLDGKSPY